MSRFALQLKKIQTETADLYAKASPLVKAIATRIMDPFTTDEEANPLGDDAQAIQDLFNTWPADSLTERLSQLTHVLSGYQPKVARKSPGMLRCYRHNNITWCVLYTDGSTAYSINSNATNVSNISMGQNISQAPYAASLAEHGAFAKEILAVDGARVYSFVLGQFGAPAAARMLTELGVSLQV